MENYINFYPTPEKLLRDITKNIQFWKVDSMLEPEAGKGDIADFVKNKHSTINIDCIENNSELQATLKGKGYSVIHDDFLTFHPVYAYDLILMNPPFNKGDLHLLKALDIQKNGGRVICILNAETLKNPYTNIRKSLLNKLEELNASIEYRTGEFTSAERTTNVEIAVIDVTIPETTGSSFIFTKLKEKHFVDQSIEEVTDVVDSNYISAAVARYNLEIESGITLIREYKALSPYIMSSVKCNEYDKPILSLKVGDKDLSEIGYVKSVRSKYWNALFHNKQFTGPMTSNQRDEYSQKISELVGYDFSVSNIKELQIQICGSLIQGIEDSIMKLFEYLSYVHAWIPESSRNIHYYDGWATNKSWFVNDKVILPMYAYDNIFKRMRVDNYDIINTMCDMEKAFNYLAGCPGADVYVGNILSDAKKEDITKNIKCKWFTLTFYKKGTVHITFTDMDILKKLNIFGGKGKNMLPPRYGKVSYDDMTPKEQEVVNEFDGGKDEYMKIYAQKDKYIVQENSLMLPMAM